MKILFTNTSTLDIEKPKPSAKFIPEWYASTESYIGGVKKPGGNGNTLATIKRCMPVFDSITAGYIITTPADVYVSIKDGEQFFEWPALDLITFHPITQAPKHPSANSQGYPKWMNPWAIKTPKGYSTLFVQPMHRESVFTILPGIVDTDTYTATVNFPFVISDLKFEGMIPKGTPLVQVIPFKRDNWTLEFGSKKELEENYKITKNITLKFFDRYKSMFWTRKQFN